MPGKAYVGRVGGLAVALGVGAAIVTGWGSGPAWADETGGTAASTESSTASGAEAKKADPSDEQGPTKPGDGSISKDAPTSTTKTPPETAADDGPSNKPKTSKKSDPATPKPVEKKTPRPATSAVDPKSDATVSATATATHKETTAADPTDSATPVRIATTQAVSIATPSAKLTTVPTPKPLLPMVTAVTSLVSGVVNAILSPFAASNTPGTPAATPSIWSLLAFARREFENAFTAPSLAASQVGTQTTGQTVAEPGQRTLILTAFPAEADAILARTTLDPNPSVVVDGHHFYLGTLGGKKVIVAMTGIGMVNATETTETALDHFTPESGISIGAVVFSGVAGGSGRTEIGDVAVPARWTSDDGATWHAVDAGMLAAANTLHVDLRSTDTIGDPACGYCGPLSWLPLVNLNRKPDLFVGGDGSSDDNNNGTAFPAIPSIPLVGDIFGPQPFAAPDFSPLFIGNFFTAIVPFLAGGLLSNLTGLLSPMAPAVDAVDQETAAAQQVADAHGIPFLGVRGMSDGPGDPLHLPGYPFTFVVYKQIAADNAAIVTEAFLESWTGP
ncbi:5'-methylthioadenosine/S-adenosylhomocysteine nucleosidase [Mycolicibacterium moriokaense]|uniref:Phosphorylase superfamily protein n=1 Tax=Mycolicibacterium moriokaense TaxID=39691 RepID=A0A318HUA6_9MYCO|nr:5'-methylthioadenosine/S-adenosylhomocysteine nucleosidase [Mycolicibacterium moriokaense]PXX08718.1 phosphorylase superfamily protein [Mycolicibacterium moriokaense]